MNEDIVEGYGFLSFARKFGDKYGKKLTNPATKTGMDATKTASKRLIQKTLETTGEVIANKIAHKIISAGKRKSKEKEKEINERQEIYIPTVKRQQIIDGLRLRRSFRHYIKIEYQKNCRPPRCKIW